MLPTKMILNNNEIILKEILPRKSFFFNTTEKIRMVFSVFYLAISVFFILSDSPVIFFWNYPIFCRSLLGCFQMGVKIFRYQKQLLPYYKPKNNYCKKNNT